MSLTLARVELNNFRLHKNVVFEPKQTGLVTITGPNGSGKSSIVNAVEWALYGTKHKGISKNSDLIREGVDPKKTEVFVKVDFISGDTVYRVIRTIKSASLTEAEIYRSPSLEDYKNDKSEGKMEIEDRDPFAAGVSDVSREVKRILGMDEKGFLTAVKVAQKEVDGIILSGKAERGKVIEDLTGISSLTIALKKAREEHRDLKKTSEFFTASRDDLNALQAEVDALIPKVGDKREALVSVRDDAKEKKESFDQLKEEVRQQQEIVDQNKMNSEKIIEIKGRIKAGEVTVSDLLQERQDKKKELTVFGHSPMTLDAAEKAMSSLNAEMSSLSSARINLESRVSSIESKKKSLDESIAKKGYEKIEDLIGEMRTLKADSESLQNEINDLQDQSSSVVSEGKKINVAIDALTQDDGTCPTCLQRVADPSEAVELLQGQVASLRKKNKEIKSSIEEKKALLAEKKTNFDELNQIRVSWKSIAEDIETIESMKKEIMDYEFKEKIVSNKIKSAESDLADARDLKSKKDEYDRIIARYNKADEVLSGLKSQLSSLEESIGENKPLSEAKMASLRKKMDAASDAYIKVAEKYSSDKADYKEIEESLKYKQKELDAMKESVEKYEKSLLAVERSVSALKVVEEYREDRISESIPLIEAHASEMMNRFTSGKFTQILMDHNFNVSIVRANGVKVPIGTLSGGEMSAAAIAIRLAIAIVLDTSLLILDEALVSQDLERSERILSVVKDYFHGQIILIAHSSVIHEVSDQNFELNRDD